MQIVVLSDTHGNSTALKAIVDIHRNADWFIHCGDGERETAVFLTQHPEYSSRFYFVKGNCDLGSISPPILTLDMPFGHRLVAIHGHQYAYGDVQKNLVALAKQNEADLLLFGHFHAREDTTVDGIHLFSPGSAARPRDGKPAAYGLITVYESDYLTSHGAVPQC